MVLIAFLIRVDPRKSAAEYLRPQSWRLAASSNFIPQNRAAKTDCPTMRRIREEDPFERVRCGASFVHPVNAAIVRLQHCSFSAYCPTLSSVNKPNVVQVCNRS